jgi:DNA (cytosine-5)-methyltransferase 1
MLKVSGNDTKLEVEVVEDATLSNKKVSKRGLKPLIEITEGMLPTTFIQGAKLRISFSCKKLVISLHHSIGKQSSRVSRLLKKLSENKPLDFISMFSGGGVFDRAAHEALEEKHIKSRVAVCVEKEKKYLVSNIRNNAMLYDESSIAINAAIEDIDFNRCVLEGDIGIISIPCTGASKAGRTKNKIKNAEDHKDAGHTFHYALNLWMRSNLPIVMIECVKEYLSSASYSVIEKVAMHEGYTIVEMVLNGQEFGALENRNRMISVAITNELLPYFGDAKGIDKYKENSTISVSDILEEVPHDSDMWKDFQYLIDKEERDRKAKKGFRRVVLNGTETKVPVIGRSYAKCRSNEPFVGRECDGKTRLLTVAEHASAKTIPLELVNGVSTTVAHEIMGQAGIYKKIKAVFSWIGDSLNTFVDDTELKLAI